jgi:ATP-dependent Clp protease protease subunit
LKELSRNSRVQVALFSRFTGIEFDDMGTWLCRDSYMSADMAIELGLIDAVV